MDKTYRITITETNRGWKDYTREELVKSCPEVADMTDGQMMDYLEQTAPAVIEDTIMNSFSEIQSTSWKVTDNG